MSSSPPATAPTALPPIPPGITQITAPLIFGILFNWTLFGVLCVQVYVYARSFKTDRSWMKALVYFVFVFEIVQTAMTGADMYFWFAAGFGNVLELANSQLSPIDIPFFVAFMSLIVQSFFAYRIYTIKKSFWFAVGVIVILAFMQAGAGFCVGITAMLNQGFSASQQRNTEVAAGIWLGGNAAVDVIIALTMTYLLLSSRRQEHGFSSDMLTNIVRLTVETNTITAMMSIISLGVEYGTPATPYYYTPTAIMGKLYSNTLLVTLNNRLALREMRMRAPIMPSSRDKSSNGRMNVKVETVTLADVESGSHATMKIGKYPSESSDQ